MKKTFTCLITLLSAFTLCNAQKNGEGVVLNNYSTSYAAKSNTEPFVLTAIPYGGMYNMFQENTPLDLSVSTSDFRYRAQTENYRELDTYDSSEVYFYVPNVFARNAAQYEYRVMKNQKEIITGWSSITHFTKGNLQVEDFKKNFASLGGYKTTWNNYITVELRKKGTSKILSAALVYWKQVKPAISAIYPSSQLNNFLIRLKRPWDGKADKENAGWQKNHMINNKLVLQAPESSLIFYLDADIYKRDALEYQLEQDGKIIKPWQPNDFDNGIIWLNNLSPGEFILRMRFSGQRHNVTSYPFKIKPEWHQTTFFKIIAGGLIAAFFSFIIVLLALGRQKRRTAEEQSKKARLGLELKALHAQLNPHFVFNALSSIQGLINKNNIAGANKYLSKFGALMRSSLEAGEKDLISLDKEIEALETYLSLEQLRFGFKYAIHTDAAINPAETDIPALLLQPVVENAVKHGVAGLEEKGQITLSFTRQGNDMLVTVADNGSGFKYDGNNKGLGLKLTRERIHLLNEILKGRPVALSIEEDGQNGAAVCLLLKNWWL